MPVMCKTFVLFILCVRNVEYGEGEFMNENNISVIIVIVISDISIGRINCGLKRLPLLIIDSLKNYDGIALGIKPLVHRVEPISAKT